MIFETKPKKINLEDLNIYELVYFNEILKHTFSNRIEEEEKRLKNDKYFIYYKINNLRDFEKIIGKSNDLIDKCVLLIYFNCNTFKELLVKVNLENDKYNEIINIILNKMFEYLIDLKEKMKKNRYIENYFFESFQLSHGSFSNYYKFSAIELDFGKSQVTYSRPIIVKTKIKYKKILNDEFKNIDVVIDTMKLDRDICLNLIQLFLRTTFERITNGVYYNKHNDDNLYKLNDKDKGKFIECNRNCLVEFQDKFITDDVEKLFQYFEIIDYDKKCVFLQATEAYLEGLKSNNGKELMFFIIALETLANYEYKDNQSKSNKIFKLISQLYSREIVSNDYIDYIYNLRSLYSHQGISNNRIKQNIFNVFENNKHLLSEVEKITYSTIIKWLINEGEKYAGK